MTQPTKPENRIGKFRVSIEIIDRGWHNLILLFGSFVVVEARYRYDLNVVEYLAYSQMFDEIPKGVEAPFYELETANMPEGTVVLKATRLE